MFKNIIICGDSFNAPSTTYKETHWSEVLSKKLNLNLYNNALPGASNQMIVYQVLDALKYKDNSLFIIGAAAGYNRIEVLRTPGVENIKSDADGELSDFCYSNKHTGYVTFDIHSDTVYDVVNLGDNHYHSNHPSNQFIKDYILNMPMQLQKDYSKWAFHYMLHELIRNQCDFLFLEEMSWPRSKLFNDDELRRFVQEKNIITKKNWNTLRYYQESSSKFVDPGYHTSPESQTILADTMFNIIQEYLSKSKL